MPVRHIHLHLKDQAGGFVESQHPRSHGRFAKKGTGTAGKVVKAAGGHAKKLATSTLHHIGSTGKEDYEALQKHFNSGTRRSLGSHIRTVAGALPAWLKTHFHEQKDTVINAGRALRTIAGGSKPSGKEMYDLARFGTMVTMSGLGLLHGDPTGAVGHAVMGLVQDIAQHTAVEHAAESAAGLGRYAYAKIRGRDQAPNASEDIEYELLKKYLLRLAENIEKMPVKGQSGAKTQ